MTYRVMYVIRHMRSIPRPKGIAHSIDRINVNTQTAGSMIVEADSAEQAHTDASRVLRDAVDHAVRSGLFVNGAEERIMSVLPCEPPRQNWSEVLAVALAKMNGG